MPVPASIKTSPSISIADVRDPAPMPPLQPKILMRILIPTRRVHFVEKN